MIPPSVIVSACFRIIARTALASGLGVSGRKRARSRMAANLLEYFRSQLPRLEDIGPPTAPEETTKKLDVEAIQKIIGYAFKTDDGRRELKLAMTVPSAAGLEDHRMLALVGDALLRAHFTLMKYCCRTTVDNQGTLTQKVAEKVSNETLDKVGTRIRLDQHLIVEKTTILANKSIATAIEAILTAVFFDNGGQLGWVTGVIEKIFADSKIE